MGKNQGGGRREKEKDTRGERGKTNFRESIGKKNGTKRSTDLILEFLSIEKNQKKGGG